MRERSWDVRMRYEWKLAGQGSCVSGMELAGGLLPIHHVGRLCIL